MLAVLGYEASGYTSSVEALAAFAAEDSFFMARTVYRRCRTRVASRAVPVKDVTVWLDELA